MSIWQFNAAAGGYRKAHSTEDTLSTDEAEMLAAWIDEKPVWH